MKHQVNLNPLIRHQNSHLTLDNQGSIANINTGEGIMSCMLSIEDAETHQAPWSVMAEDLQV